MSRVMETTVYKFDELSERAKEKAREWFREGNLDYDWWEFVYEDAERIAERLGIEFRTHEVKLYGGGARHDSCIYFRGFYSQGDGACFEGTYSYKKGSVKAIKEYAPQDKTLHSIAEGLYEIQRQHFYRVTASVKHSGHYCHAYCMDIEVDVDGRYDKEASDGVTELLRDFANWIYKQLEAEYDYRMSDEAVDQDIEANDYEFDEDGHPA